MMAHSVILAGLTLCVYKGHQEPVDFPNEHVQDGRQ